MIETIETIAVSSAISIATLMLQAAAVIHTVYYTNGNTAPWLKFTWASSDISAVDARPRKEATHFKA